MHRLFAELIGDPYAREPYAEDPRTEEDRDRRRRLRRKRSQRRRLPPGGRGGPTRVA
jgi:hypothetical protein